LQRDLSVQHNRIGDLLINMGRREEALDAYRRNVAIVERLASGDLGNTSGSAIFQSATTGSAMFILRWARRGCARELPQEPCDPPQACGE
jgi:hypothetical protein